MMMKACENHEKSVVVFNEDICPLCNAEKALKKILVEIEKSMGILQELKGAADETGMKKKYGLAASEDMDDKNTAAARLAEADLRARELVNAVQSILVHNVPDLSELKKALINLFEYLSSPNGRTAENCNAINSFFVYDDLWVDRNLPDHFQAIFVDVSGAFHDTVSAQEIAENFDSTPEQLLKRAKELNTQQSAPLNREYFQGR
jgi:hypothetical protein